MQISVVILNYNVAYYLYQCIQSVQKALQYIDSEIIVVDNASKDNSSQLVQKYFPKVKYIYNNENLGFPKGNNIGVFQAQGDYICVLNPDTVVAENTFLKILDFFNQSKNELFQSNIGILGSKLIDGTGKFLPESKRGVPTPWVACTKIFGLYKYFPQFTWFNKYYAQHLLENENGKVDVLVGAFMVMSRKMYIDVGGFDENCFMYSDDIDLSYRVRKTGKYNFYFSETSVIHYKGESTIKDQNYFIRFNDAMQYFYSKHFRKNFLLDWTMRLGAFFYSLFKKNQRGAEKKVIRKAIFVSNRNCPTGWVLPLTTLNLDNLRVEDFQNIETTAFVFDTQVCKFEDIIQIMEKFQGLNIYFYNYFENIELIIGSHNSNSRGEVYLGKKLLYS